MCSTELNPDPCFALGHHREKESHHIYPLFEQFCCHFLSHSRFVQHDGHNGMVSWFDIETLPSHFLPKITGVPFEFISQLSGFTEHIEYGDGCTDDAWSKCIGK
jgi:hypothetical protein